VATTVTALRSFGSVSSVEDVKVIVTTAQPPTYQ
jgi:hypothetical protein